MQEELAKGNAVCINCGEFVSQRLLHDFSFGNVIASHECVRGRNSVAVPRIVRKLYPNIGAERYKALKSNVDWLKESVKVCEDCYLELTNS